MKSYSLYDKKTGLFTGQVFIGGEESLAVNTPDSCSVMEGIFDSLSQRVDIATGKVVGYQPPAPAGNEFEKFSWDMVSKRWKSAPTQAAIARDARAKRTLMLAASDWTQVADVDLTEGDKKSWASYRKALRDIPKQDGFPNSITWPIPPSA